jgi:CAP12/Pycsar effector protein, TIR domain
MLMNVFIGSSKEGKRYAQTISEAIEDLKGYAALPWWSAFQVGAASIEDLTTAARKVKAAVFVATPDDHRVMRRKRDTVVRDNVLYEYGLFSGKLGRIRTALVVVEDAVCPTDLLGVTHITLPKRKRESWSDYKAKFVDGKIHSWLQGIFDSQRASGSIAGEKERIYKCLEAETTLKRNGLFGKVARESPQVKYLLLRGRDVLKAQGEIAMLDNHGGPHLEVRLLLVDFEKLSLTRFEEIKNHMNVHLDGCLETERKLAKERLAFAKRLSRASKRIDFHYRVLPVDCVPEIKLRIYKGCGFFSFYRGMGDIHNRPVFWVQDDPLVEDDGSRLLARLDQMFDNLWDAGRTP